MSFHDGDEEMLDEAELEEGDELADVDEGGADESAE